MNLFKLFKIKIKIAPVLLLITGICIYFQMFYEIIMVMGLVMVHELSHSITSKFYGIKVSEIVLFPFGGVAKTDGYLEMEPEKEIMIAAAGPALNFVLFFLGHMLLFFKYFESYYLHFFNYSNLLIGSFNLLPVLPLDGGRIIRAVICSRSGYKKGTETVIKTGKILCVFLFLSGIYLGTQNIKGFYLSIVALFLYIKNHKEKEIMSYLSIYQIIIKKRFLLNKGIMDTKTLTALDTVDLKKIFKEFTSGKYHFITVIDEKGRIIGNLTESEILDALVNYNNKMTLSKLIILLNKPKNL